MRISEVVEALKAEAPNRSYSTGSPNWDWMRAADFLARSGIGTEPVASMEVYRVIYSKDDIPPGPYIVLPAPEEL